MVGQSIRVGGRRRGHSNTLPRANIEKQLVVAFPYRMPAVRRVRLGQDFDRHLAIEPGIARPIHFAHATGAEQSDDFMRAENGSGRQAQAALTV
jgi:hypothetical protein